ncbi:MAG: HutD family protein [Lachnospiraceae bacterium]
MIEVIQKKAFKVSKWSGGTTTQLLIWPRDSDYVKGDFEFRISSATVEDECSVFTKLNNTHRFIGVLEGSLELTFNQQKKITLKPYQVQEFEGDWDTVSYGQAKDFNLMVKKGRGQMDSCKVEGEQSFHLEAGHYFFYSVEGELQAKIGKEQYLVGKGEGLHCLIEQEEMMELKSSQPAVYIRVKVTKE